MTSQMSTRFRLSVCPHDTAKFMVEWFQFNTYLQRQLGCSIHFEPEDNFLVERENVLSGDFHIVYANPFSALAFMRRRGFLPVAKVAGLFDETFLVAQAGAGGVPRQRPLRIASATDRLIVHPLGVDLLERLKIPQTQCEYRFVGNHMKAAHAVIKGEADLAFVFNETWLGMAEATRQQLEVIAESTDRSAFHCFCIAPEWAARKAEIQRVLIGMHDDPKGRAILDALHFGPLEPLDSNALDPLIPLLQRAGLQD